MQGETLKFTYCDCGTQNEIKQQEKPIKMENV